MEKHSAAYAAEMTKRHQFFEFQRFQYGIKLPEGLSRFAFRRPCLVECEVLFLWGQRKAKKNKNSAFSAPLR